MALRRVDAVLLDALGTLVALEPPGPLLRGELAARGRAVSLAEADAAMAREMAFYRAKHARAVDAAGLAGLRADCARVLDEALPPAARGLPDLLDVLMASLRFSAYPDAAPALRALRGRGVRLVVCSNWDVSLHEVLSRTGLAPLVDGVVTSAELGVAKPDPAIFGEALEVAGGVRPERALHVGDDPDADLAGARGAGLEALLLDRSGRAPGALRSLGEVLQSA